MTNSQILEHKQFMRRIFETTTVEDADGKMFGLIPALYAIEKSLHASEETNKECVECGQTGNRHTQHCVAVN